MARMRVLEQDVFEARMMEAVGVRIRMGRLLRGVRVAPRFFMEDRFYFILQCIHQDVLSANSSPLQ